MRSIILLAVGVLLGATGTVLVARVRPEAAPPIPYVSATGPVASGREATSDSTNTSVVPVPDQLRATPGIGSPKSLAEATRESIANDRNREALRSISGIISSGSQNWPLALQLLKEFCAAYGWNQLTVGPSKFLGMNDPEFSIWILGRREDCPQTIRKGAAEYISTLPDHLDPERLLELLKCERDEEVATRLADSWGLQTGPESLQLVPQALSCWQGSREVVRELLSYWKLGTRPGIDEALRQLEASDSPVVREEARVIQFLRRSPVPGVIVTDSPKDAVLQLHVSDLIVSVDGLPVTSWETFRDAMGVIDPAKVVNLGVYREGCVESVPVRAGFWRAGEYSTACVPK